MQKKLSVIIVAYNAVDLLCECLDSLFKFNDIGAELEVIVSDNSPTQEVYNCVKTKYANVVLMHNQVNLGFGRGNNIGAQKANGKYLLFLNPDTILVEPIFKFAIKKFEMDEKLGLFGLKLINREKSPNHSFFVLDTFGIAKYMFQSLLWNMDIFIPRIMFTSGADIFIRRDLFDNIGGFDEKIFMYFEESDILKRIRSQDKKIKNRYFNERSIIHAEGGTSQNIIEKRKIIERQDRYLQSLKYYCIKHGMDYKKIIIQEIFFCKIRMFKYKVCGETEKYREMTLQVNEKIGFIRGDNVR